MNGKDDPRIGDFKFLLPWGEKPSVRIGTRMDRFARALRGEFTEPGSEPCAIEFQTVEEGGIRCVSKTQPLPGRPRRWLAYPRWPEFRFLIPDTEPARRAARAHGLGGEAASGGWLPGFSAAPATGVETVGMEGGAFFERVLAELESRSGLLGTSEIAWDRVVLHSGALGEGNPVILFVLNGRGEPCLVLKIGRKPGLEHVRREAESLGEIAGALGACAARALPRVLDCFQVSGYWVSCYLYAPSIAMRGLRWKLWTKPRTVEGVTRWLAEAYTRTARVHGERAICLEHGDLGTHNLRVDPAGGFRILDWASHTFDGVPFADLLTLLVSARVSGFRARRNLRLYAALTRLPAGSWRGNWERFVRRRAPELAGGPYESAFDAMTARLDSLLGKWIS
jgi:hypothetical protein